MTSIREQKIADVQARRFRDLHVVLENVDDPHNLGAIFRTCEAVGVGMIHLLYTKNKPPRMHELRNDAAASAVKWLEFQRWGTVQECIAYLRQQNLRVLVTALFDQGKAQWEWDLISPTAIVIGNEHEGISKEILSVADGVITIPMRGMVQSLNVSVATAVVLEEALRQRIIHPVNGVR